MTKTKQENILFCILLFNENCFISRNENPLVIDDVDE
jgi:hypothetical protein